MHPLGNDPGLPDILNHEREEALVRSAEALSDHAPFHGKEAMVQEAMRDARGMRLRGEISIETLQRIHDVLCTEPLILEFPADDNFPRAA